jgi:hypothetical protein
MSDPVFLPLHLPILYYNSSNAVCPLHYLRPIRFILIHDDTLAEPRIVDTSRYPVVRTHLLVPPRGYRERSTAAQMQSKNSFS